MKQKTIDLLLDCYIKERIQNADAILEESTNVPMPKARSHTFSFAPTPPWFAAQHFDGDPSNDVSPLVKQRSHTFSFAPTPPGYQHLDIAQNEMRSGHLVSDDVIDGVDKREEQKCREVARRLAKVADEFQERYMSTCSNGKPRSFSDQQGYTQEERNTLERIYSEGPSQSVSGIASTLTNCFTPQTLQATIRYLSGQSDDISQQLAITLELSTHVVRVMGGRVLDTIRSAVTEIFQDCAELEDL